MQFPNKSRLSHISLRSQRCKPTRHWRPSLPWEPSGRHQFLHLHWVFHTFWDSIFPASLVAWALASNSKFLPSFPLVIILLGPNGGLLYKWSPLTPRLHCQLQIFSDQGTCFSSVPSLSHVQLFVTPWTAARQASLLSCCHPLLLPPSTGTFLGLN